MKLLSKIKSRWQAARRKQKETLTREESEFLPAILEITENPVSPTIRGLLWTIVAFVGVAFLWSVVGTVEEVAVAPGKIIPSGFVKVIQSESKGVVKAILVQEGQFVKKDDLLLELDQTISSADLSRIKKDIANYRLDIERMLAELNDTEFNPASPNDLDASDLSFQRNLYLSRKAEFTSKILAAQHNLMQNRITVKAARINRDKLFHLYEIAKEKESRIEKLWTQNAVSQFTVLDYRGRRIELEQNLLAQEAEMLKAEAALAESNESLKSLTAERNRDLSTKIVETRRRLQPALEELTKAEEKNRLTRLTAPIDGRVTQMVMHTIGGVVTEAQVLMVIVPNDVKLEVEAWVANQDIGFISKGLPAQVKVETFNFQKYGYLDAQVSEISADAIDDKSKGRVYRATLNLNRNYVNVGEQKVYLSPGMTVVAEIKTRKKRIIEFFLDPFRKYQDEGLRER